MELLEDSIHRKLHMVDFKHSDESKKKISESHKNMSIETKQKMSESAKKRWIKKKEGSVR